MNPAKQTGRYEQPNDAVHHYYSLSVPYQDAKHPQGYLFLAVFTFKNAFASSGPKTLVYVCDFDEHIVDWVPVYTSNTNDAVAALAAVGYYPS